MISNIILHKRVVKIIIQIDYNDIAEGCQDKSFNESVDKSSVNLFFFVDIFLYLLKTLKKFDIILILVDNLGNFININHIYTHRVDNDVYNLEFSLYFNIYVSKRTIFFCVQNNHCYC